MILALQRISYSALSISDLTAIPANLIASGIDCLGSSLNQFDDDKVVKFRNIQNRSILAIINNDPILSAYVRVKTAATVSGLDFEDLIFEVPAASGIQVRGGFTDLFQTQGEAIETVLGAPVTRVYNDFIEFNISHDSTTPDVAAGVFYV